MNVHNVSKGLNSYETPIKWSSITFMRAFAGGLSGNVTLRATDELARARVKAQKTVKKERIRWLIHIACISSAPGQKN